MDIGDTVGLKGVVESLTEDEVTVRIGDGPVYAYVTLNIEAVIKKSSVRKLET